MKIRGKHKIKCERQLVWDRLMDFKFLSGVIPSGHRFKEVGDHKFKGTLRLNVGPVNDKISLTLTRKNINEPDSLTLNVYSKGKVNGDIDFRLKRKGKCETELIIRGKLKFPGIPGIFGVVIGEMSNKLKKTIKELVAKIEEDCQRIDKAPPTEDAQVSVGEVSELQSQFEEEQAGIIRKAREKLQADMTESLDTATAELTTDMLELIKKIENERKQET